MSTHDSKEFIGALLEASIAQTHSTMNAINDRGWEEASKWAQAFRALFDAVERNNDSVRVDRILGSYGSMLHDIDRTLEHYENMKMGNRE